MKASEALSGTVPAQSYGIEKIPGCKVCQHEARAIIDIMLADSSVSVRHVSAQFGMASSSVQRHKTMHLVGSALKRAVSVRTAEHRQEIESKWIRRLDDAYQATVEGNKRALTDEKQWPSGARYLAVAAKLIDSGLRADGVIGANDSGPVTHIGQVIVMPQLNALESSGHATTLDLQSSAIDSGHETYDQAVTNPVTNDDDELAGPS